MRLVKFLGSAKDDLKSEKSYYRKINPDLARKFQLAVEVAVQSISRQPLAMQVIENEVRRWPLETFPHGVLYRDTEDFVLILAVFHPNQSPEKLQEITKA